MGQLYFHTGVSPARAPWKSEFLQRGGRVSPRGRHTVRCQSAGSPLSSRWQARRSISKAGAGEGGRTMLMKRWQVKLETGREGCAQQGSEGVLGSERKDTCFMRTWVAPWVSSSEAGCSLALKALRGKSLSVSAERGRELGCPRSLSVLLSLHSRLILIMSHPG